MSGHDLAQGPLDPLLFFGLKFLDLNQTPEVVVGGDGIEPPGQKTAQGRDRQVIAASVMLPVELGGKTQFGRCRAADDPPKLDGPRVEHLALPRYPGGGGEVIDPGW
jgi:hypothetical protein